MVTVYYNKRIHGKIHWENVHKSRVQQRSGVDILMSSLSRVTWAVLISPSNNAYQCVTSAPIQGYSPDPYCSEILLEAGPKDMADCPWD